MKNIIVFSIFKKFVIFLILISISSCVNNEAQKKKNFNIKELKQNSRSNQNLIPLLQKKKFQLL